MNNELVSSLSGIALAIVGLGVIATLVSKNANTATVISSTGSAFSGAISAAEGPVSGGSLFGGTGYYGSGF